MLHLMLQILFQKPCKTTPVTTLLYLRCWGARKRFESMIRGRVNCEMPSRWAIEMICSCGCSAFQPFCWGVILGDSTFAQENKNYCRAEHWGSPGIYFI